MLRPVERRDAAAGDMKVLRHFSLLATWATCTIDVQTFQN
jgi:hypothetical protein